jgi:hypothetical protein
MDVADEMVGLFLARTDGENGRLPVADGRG